MLKQGREFVITVDDSPYSFSSEAMSIHIIDEDKWSVMEFLAGCNMYEESPDGKGTADLLIAFMKIFGLERYGWKCLIMDGSTLQL